MAITEGQRHHLFQRLEEVLGTEEATTLMEHLPPVGWADVATKTDLDYARAELKSEFAVLRAELDSRLERGFREQTRTVVLANLSSTIAFGSLVLAAIKL